MKNQNTIHLNMMIRQRSEKPNCGSSHLVFPNPLSRLSVSQWTLQQFRILGVHPCLIPHGGALARAFGSNLPTDVVTFVDTLQALRVASCGCWVLCSFYSFYICNSSLSWFFSLSSLSSSLVLNPHQ